MMDNKINGFFEFDGELVDYEIIILDKEDDGDEVTYTLEVSFNGVTFEMEYCPNDDCSCYYCGSIFDDFQDTEGYKEEEAFFYQGFNYVTLVNNGLSNSQICQSWDMLDVLINDIKNDIVYY